MNNYLYANLANGKISNGISGAGQSGNLPLFILGEENKYNLYFTDFPKPTLYPSPALGDNFFYEPKTQVLNVPYTIRAGTRSGPAIISETIASNTNNLDRTITASSVISNLFEFKTALKISTGNQPPFGAIEWGTASYQMSGAIGLSGAIPTTPVEGFFNTGIGTLPYFYSGFEIQNLVQKYGDGVTATIYAPFPDEAYPGGSANYSSDTIRQTLPSSGITAVQQTGDYSYAFSYSNFIFATRSYPSYDNPPTYQPIEATIVSSSSTSLLGPAGKYGTINFNSPDWNTLIGNNDEVQIWLEIIVSNQTVAQGSAILRKKLSV
jgi:hypothetical protein